jgi:uncharacterized membrane protein YhhN
MERRPWLLGSLACAIAYYLLSNKDIGGLYLIGFKGAAAAMLAVYAMLRHAGPKSRLLAGSFAFCAMGDIILELYPAYALIPFFGAHLCALGLYLGSRRAAPTHSQKMAALAILLLIPMIVALSTFRQPGFAQAVLYSITLAGMAAAAWMSRFPRYRAGIGALLFASGHVLLLAGPSVALAAYWLSWPLYYAGLFLISVGVIPMLRGVSPSR